MKTSTIAKTSIAALGLAALLTGTALAQRGAESTARQGTPEFTRAQAIVSGVNDSYGTGFEIPPANPAPSPGFAPTAVPTNEHTSWQFGPWLGRYPDGN